MGARSKSTLQRYIPASLVATESILSTLRGCGGGGGGGGGGGDVVGDIAALVRDLKCPNCCSLFVFGHCLDDDDGVDDGAP